jgi:putative molybdopterin biosynthesis protein
MPLACGVRWVRKKFHYTTHPVDIGAIAGSGHASVMVRRKPRTAIIPTGSELVSSEDAAVHGIKPGHLEQF